MCEGGCIMQNNSKPCKTPSHFIIVGDSENKGCCGAVALLNYGFIWDS